MKLLTVIYLAVIIRSDFSVPVNWASHFLEREALKNGYSNCQVLERFSVSEYSVCLLISRVLEIFTNAEEPVPDFYCDSASAKNCEFHRRCKYIDDRFHYVRELLKLGKLSIHHVISKNQVADICTKLIQRTIFTNLLGMKLP